MTSANIKEMKQAQCTSDPDSTQRGVWAESVVEGNAIVVELPSGKVAGGYAFKAESSDKVKASQLESDFFTNSAKALTAGLAKAEPGATYAFEVRATRK